MFELIATENFALFENFERVHLLSVFLLDQEHLTVATLSDDLDCAEVSNTDSACSSYSSVAELFHLVD